MVWFDFSNGNTLLQILSSIGSGLAWWEVTPDAVGLEEVIDDLLVAIVQSNTGRQYLNKWSRKRCVHFRSQYKSMDHPKRRRRIMVVTIRNSRNEDTIQAKMMMVRQNSLLGVTKLVDPDTLSCWTVNTPSSRIMTRTRFRSTHTSGSCTLGPSERSDPPRSRQKAHFLRDNGGGVGGEWGRCRLEMTLGPGYKPTSAQMSPHGYTPTQPNTTGIPLSTVARHHDTSTSLLSQKRTSQCILGRVVNFIAAVSNKLTVHV